MKKKLSIFLLACIMALGVAILPAACKDTGGDDQTDSVTLKFSDPLFWEPLYMNEEYDAMGLIEAEEGVTYSIVSCTYFDSSLTKHDIPFSGMKFTQTEPYNVTLELEAKKGEATDSDVAELKIDYKSTEVINEIMSSWNDDGVAKSLVAKPEFLKDDATVSLAARYIGNRNPVGNNGMAIGILQSSVSSCSVTNWDNAVLTLDVYNPQDYELKFGMQYSKDKYDWDYDVTKTLAANDWTHLVWSFRAMDYAGNFFETGCIYFKMGVLNVEDGESVDYTVYMCNIDIVDYSAEKFPDLDTRTPQEIADEAWASTPGDEIDKRSALRTTRTANFKAEISTDQICPGVESSTSSVKYTFTQNPAHTFPTKNRGTLLEDTAMSVFGAPQYSNGSSYQINGEEIDFENLCLGFWLKTDHALNLAVYFANSYDGTLWHGAPRLQFEGYNMNKNVSASGEWQYVEFSIGDMLKSAMSANPEFSALYENVYGTDAWTSVVRHYRFSLCNESVLEDGQSISFYLDGMKLYSKAPESNTDKILASIMDTYKDAQDNPNITTDRTIVTDTVTGSGTTSLKIDNSGTFNPAGNNGVGIGFLAGGAFFSVTDWSNAVLSLDVYNAADYDLKFGLQITPDGGTTWQFDVSHRLAAGEWTHIDWSLRRIGYSAFGINTVCFKVGTWDNRLDEQVDYTLYLCNVDVVDYSAEQFPDLETRTDDEIVQDTPSDVLDKEIVLHAKKDYTAEISTEVYCPDVEASTSSVKFTTLTGGRGTFLLDEAMTLFGDLDGVDWENLHLGFWVKTDVALNIVVCFTNTQDGTTWHGSPLEFYGYHGNLDIAPNDGWQYIEFNVSDLMKQHHTALFATGVTAYKFALCNESGAAVFYLDGLSIFSKAAEQNDSKILKEIGNTYKDAQDQASITTERAVVTDMVTGNGTASLKIDNNGTFNPIGNNGVGIGFLAGNSFFSVTDWSNAVLSLDVYNAADYDLKFGLQITPDGGANWQFDVTHRLAAGEWTHIDWSLRRIGYLAFAVNTVCFKVGTYEDKPDTQVDYTIYLCNVDVTDYSAERFPDLETRTDEEIADAAWAAIPGDDLDKKIGLRTGRDGNYTAEVDAEVYCDRVTGSASSVKFTFTQDPLTGNPNVNRGTLISDANGTLFGEFDVTDWSNAYLGFWAKTGDISNNNSWCAATVQLRFATTADGVTYTGSEYFNFQNYQQEHDQWLPVNNDAWIYYEFSLNSLNIGTEGVTGFKFSLCAECALKENGQTLSFYLDGLDIYTGSRK